MSDRKYRIFLLTSILCLIACALLALCTGRYTIRLRDAVLVLFSGLRQLLGLSPMPQSWDAMAENVIYTLRLPRVAAAILVGGSCPCPALPTRGSLKTPW